MRMEQKTEFSSGKATGPEQPTEACTTGSCRTGGCGGPGLCPGVAILLAYVLGAGIVLLTGLNWLGWAVGIPVGLILITGAWRFLPKSSKGHAQ